ncbi:hypothetical protein CDV36_005573 [Fusarium kuroshium]|uniref:Uncharacterized protein n=2 Tax=Fusarium solani species complex TaxID=232080 RepID=A0A3M2SB40_9HYPO|nr:hypothetical protein CDV36_005573 [Fusarium kuroshium]
MRLARLAVTIQDKTSQSAVQAPVPAAAAMDITRGSRRARHVAAAHTTPNAAAAAAASSPQGIIPNTSSPAGTPSGPARLPPTQGASPAAALVTPDAPAALHRTPDQPPDRQRRRAPPPNPFRLYRSE